MSKLKAQMPDLDVDAYLRGEMDEATEEAFELELLESPQLQSEVEATLAIRELVRATINESVETTAKKNNKWFSSRRLLNLAAAASFVWAAVTSVFLWQSQPLKTLDNIAVIRISTVRSINSIETEPLFVNTHLQMLVLDLSFPKSPIEADMFVARLSPLEDTSGQTFTWTMVPDKEPLEIQPNASENYVLSRKLLTSFQNWQIGINPKELTAETYHLEVQAIGSDGAIVLMAKDFHLVKE